MSRASRSAVIRTALGAVSVGVLTACASHSAPVAETFRLLGSRNAAVEAAKLSTDYRYLRVSVSGRLALLTLGFISAHPTGPIETWYSAHGEVLKLQAGRIVGTAGLTTDWREVRYSAVPDWHSVMNQPATYTREHDEMPGYRIGVTEFLTLRHVPPPDGTAVRGVSPNQLLWFEEIAEPAVPTVTKLRPSRYAVETTGQEGQVVYAEQCLAEDLCLSWQRWPVGK